jgi:hypothetical protein
MAQSSTFRQADVKRAVRGALAAGLAVGRVDVERDKIVIHAKDDAEEPSAPLDQWRASRAR